MTRSIDEVQDVVHTISRTELHACWLHLDSDAALALEVHFVEHLITHFTRLNRAGAFKEPIREGRLAVINMGDDAEVADVHCVGVRRPLPYGRLTV